MIILRYFATGLLLITASTSFGQKLYRQSSSTTENLNCVAFATDSLGLIVGDQGTILKTIDSGRIWNRTGLEFTSSNLYAVYAYDALNATVAGDSGSVFALVNGIWYHPSLPQKRAVYQAVYAVVYSTADTVLAVGQLGLIYKSVDGGKSWSKQNSGTTADLHGVEFFDELNYYVTGTGGTLLYTTDGGTNWLRQDLGISRDLYSVSFPSDTGWIAGDSTLLYSIDDGATWQNLPNHDRLRSLIGVDGLHARAVGDGGVLTFTAEGQYWSHVATGTVSNLNSIDEPNEMYIVGDGGLILSTLNFPSSGVASESANDLLASVYPNPASSTLRLLLGGKEWTSVQIRNDIGSIVLEQNIYASAIDIHNLPPGTYFCDAWLKQGGLKHCRFTVVR